MHSASHLRPSLGPIRLGMVTALVCALLLSLGGPASSAPMAGGEFSTMQASGAVSLAQATQMIREQTGGQVLRAETRRDKGRVVHRIRILTEDGRVRTWHVDAESGRIY